MDIEKMVDGLTRLYWEVSENCHFCHITLEFPGPCNTMYNFSCQYRAYLGPYWSMLGHTAPYGAKLDRTRPYENLWVYRGPKANNFGSIQNHTKTYKTILDHTDPYRAILGNKRPYRAIPGHARPYQTISGPYFDFPGGPFSIPNWFDQQKAGYTEHPPWPLKIAHCGISIKKIRSAETGERDSTVEYSLLLILA